MKTSSENEEWVYLSDILRFMKKRRSRYVLFALLCALVAIGCVSLLPPRYLMEASFKEAHMRNETSSMSMLKTLLKHPAQVDLGTQAVSVMKSRQLIQAVIEEMQMQGETKLGSLKTRFCERLKDRWRLSTFAEKEKTSLCHLKHVFYTGQEVKRFYIHAHPVKGIEVYSLQKKKMLPHARDHTYREQDLLFSLELFPYAEMDRDSILEIYPMEMAIDRVLKQLKVKVRREDVTMVDLSYRASDPVQGAQFLNMLMQKYQHYLVKENERIAKAQLEYLTRRQEEIAGKLDEILNKHVQYLEENLGAQGLMGLHQELEIVESRRKRYEQRVLDIDFAMNKLQKIRGTQLVLLDILGPEGQRLQQELLGLRKQKAALDFTQLKRGSGVNEKNAHKKRRSLRTYLRMRPSFKQQQLLFTREQQLEQEKRKPLDEMFPVFAALRAHLRQLGDQQRRYISQSFPDIECEEDFHGLDLEMAKDLHLTYTHQLDEISLKRQELQLALEKMEEEDFDVSSLMHLAEDEMSRQVMQENTRLMSDLKNEKYFSDRDRVRMREQLTRNKEFLHHHFFDKIELIELRSEMMISKMSALKQEIQHLIDQEIDLTERQIERLFKEQVAALEAENSYLQEQLLKVHEELKSLPHKWLMENRMQLQSDLNISMMEGMSQLVESKNIEHHLLQVESKPIDVAYVPLKPKENSLILYGILGALLGALVLLGIDIGVRLSRGLPVSVEHLRMKHLQAIGPFPHKIGAKLDRVSARHLEMLRHMFRFFFQETPLIGGVVLNGKENYTPLLGELFHISGKKTLLIELFPRKEEKVGLMDYLTGTVKELIIKRREKFDLIPFGFAHPYAMEILSRRGWPHVLEQLQQMYSVILIVTRTQATHSETQQLMHSLQKVVITLDEESLHDLYPYLQKKALYVALE